MAKLLFVSVFTIIVILSEAQKQPASIFETKQELFSDLVYLGFSPVCISRSLASCESSYKFPDSKNISEDLKNISVDLKDISEELKNISYSILKLIEVSKENLRSKPENCKEFFSNGDSISGVREVYPYDSGKDKKVIVYCDQTNDEGGWTVIQNRDAVEVREDFYRTWLEYSIGFGHKNGEFWLGLDHIHALVSSSLMELRIDLEDYNGKSYWAKYGIFHVGDASSNYTLTIDKYTGNAGDGMTIKNGMQFSTHDKDNDMADKNCAITYRGAWWYNNCHDSNLNGYQHEGKHTVQGTGINWHAIRGSNYSFKKASMKVRPLF